MKWSDLQLVAIVFLCTAVAYLYGSMLGLESQLVKANRQYETQQMCDRANVQPTPRNEGICGDLQTKYSTDYMCSGMVTERYCWTEVR